MRPISLTMQAFGPYAGKETIDFTKLGSRSMFVISGKTGSGKTTIFDGICFAIYGRASGDERAGTDLRSQFADEGLATEVSLEFSLRDQQYFIWRSPQQEKKKSRGEGFTVIGAKAELYKITETGEKKLIASNVRDTEEKIKEIIQLDANQFRQILMIPQGEFRKLLTSDSKEKEVILQRLFHTEIYKRVEDKLKERASVLKSQAEAGVEERSRLLRSLYCHGNGMLQEAVAVPQPDDAAVLALLVTVDSEIKEEMDRLEEKIKQQKEIRDTAKKNLDAAEGLLREIAVRDQLREQRHELLSKKEEMAEVEKSVEFAYRAYRLEQQENLCQRLKKELDEWTKRYTDTKEKLEETEKRLKEAQAALRQEEEKRGRREALASELVRLENVKEEVVQFSIRKSQLASIEQELSDCRSKLDKAKQKLTRVQLLGEEYHQKLRELEKLQLELSEKENRQVLLSDLIKKLSKARDMHTKYEIITSRANSQHDLWSKCLKRAEDARLSLEILENRLLSSHASNLAHKLTEGSPCPVCGSTQHPSPASQSSDVPNGDDVKAAKSDLALLEQQAFEAERKWIKTNAEKEALAAGISETVLELGELLPDFSLSGMEETYRTVESEFGQLRDWLMERKKEVHSISSLEQLLEDCKKDRSALEKQCEELAVKENGLAMRKVEIHTLVQRLMESLPDDVRSPEKFEERTLLVRQEMERLDSAIEKAKELVQKLGEEAAALKGAFHNMDASRQNAEKSLETERNLFVSRMEAEGFKNYKEYTLSKKTRDEIKQYENQLKLYGEELRSITDRLLDYEERLKDAPTPDREKLQVQFQEEEKNLQAYLDSMSNLLMNQSRNKDIRNAVEHINGEIKAAEQQYELIGHLSDITRGQNAARLSFERFVLASFLDEILHSANMRLIKMTGGRYKLIRKTDRSKGNVQSGLELLVFDQYTGQNRHVKTLSGGESFKAALSLALGLADVVQENAGGVSLETMFIDEGFGTLDPESLDNAIETLMDIQSTGRLVGVISHVPELKERIDARLEVISSQKGSRTEFQFLA
ncbi:MAG TPA: SMC family ATPase [Bacillaceae bacterium]